MNRMNAEDPFTDQITHPVKCYYPRAALWMRWLFNLCK